LKTVRPLAAAVILTAALAASAKSKARRPQAPPPPPVTAPTVTVVRDPDGWRADLTMDGSLLGWAAPRTKSGAREIDFLLGPRPPTPQDGSTPCIVREGERSEGRSARLYRWREEAPDRIETVGHDLPEGSLDAADLDGDGADEILLVHDGAIDLVTPSAEGMIATKELVRDPLLAMTCCGPRGSWNQAAIPDTALRTTVSGAFRTYRKRGEGNVALVSEVEIPQRVDVRPERIDVDSPVVHPVGRMGGSRMTFATEPEPLGKRRLRTLLLDPDGPPGAQSTESWALFPGPERVVDSGFAVLNGAPVLIVTTTSADKLALLAEKALRIFPLAGDRTRAGDAPIFATTTGINLWQLATPVVMDLDGDGHDDLVLAYWKGLKNTILALEVYRGTGPASFAKPRTTEIDVDDGDRGFLELVPDLDGDGRPDLVALANHQLLIFPGTAPDRVLEKTVDKRPSRRISLPGDLPHAGHTMVSMGTEGFQISRTAGGLGTPTFLDLDGDGRAEVLFVGGTAVGARAVIVFVRGAAPLAPSAKLSYE
jgi:hypothetical protein